MICISGIPASGKSTVCDRLAGLGYKCVHLSEMAADMGCVQSGEVDIDCLSELKLGRNTIVESHYSHLIGCEYVIILETSQEEARRRMEDRGYSSEKIEGNMDALLADSIYYEALERLPSVRIYRISNHEGELDETVNKTVSLLKSFGIGVER
ncbi:MAG: AAA family ATPase [Thermoplasmata archaeon]